MSRLLMLPGALLLVATLAAVGCGDDDDDDDDADAAEEEAGGGSADLAITTTDNEFSTDTLEAPADTEVMLEVTNEGDALHNWIVPSEDISMDLVQGGESAQVTFTLPAGEYEFVCEVHPDEMTGTLIVE